MKLLSIAIPCYNSQDYMRHAIETLLAGGEDVISSPGGDTVLGGSDHMLVGGNNEDILKFTKYLNKLK